MRSKQMAFLNNFNIVAMLILAFSTFRELNICVTDLNCSIEALGLFLSISYKCYSVCLLLACRYVCILTDKINKFLKWKFIIPILIGFYLFVFLLNLVVYLNAEREIIFVGEGNRCAVISKNGTFIHLMFVFNNILPSVASICGAIRIIVTIKCKNSLVVPTENDTNQSYNLKKNFITQSAYELSWQIIMFVLSFQIFTLSNFLLIYNEFFTSKFLNSQQVNFLRYLRWFAFLVDSLALFLFNPFIKKILKNFWISLKNSISNIILN